MQRKTVYEKVKTQTVIDQETGEIIDEITENESIHKANSEPDYIKLYYRTMLAFNQIEGLSLNFLLSISKFIEWANDGKPMFITLNKRVKGEIQNDCELKSAQVDRYIRLSVESGLLFRTEYRGVYEVNPFMIAKGKWDSIRSLQCQFDYLNGKWVRKTSKQENLSLESQVNNLEPQVNRQV